MCVIGLDKETKIINQDNPVVGFKTWRKFRDSKYLMSSSADFIWKNEIISGDIKDPERGVFSWLSYNNYYNYYTNYYNYNYYNNYYNYYYYNNYNYNNYNYNNYNILGEIYQWGITHFHEKGYRSEFARPKLFLNLLHKENRNKDFVDHFNKIVENLGTLYNVPVESFDDYILKDKKNESSS